MMVSDATMVAMRDLLCSGRVVAKGHEFEQPLVAFGIAYAMDAAALGKKRDAGAHRNRAAWFGTKAVYVRVRLRQRVLLVHVWIIAVAHVGNPFAFDEVIELLGSDVLMGAFDGPGRQLDLVEIHDGAAELAL